MTASRASQISLADTKYYHCISRCVRRAFLCGYDTASGQCFEHRRQWVEDKIFFLASVFCIDICAYVVMSNHFHLVLHIDDKKAKQLSDKEVLERWHKLFSGTMLTQQYLAGVELNEAKLQALKATAALYRERLFSISWFMRILNENISRRANKEDNCKGRFWEGRFKSQALLDEAALAACMAYVDLNPVRAQMAKTPEQSDFTSIKKRINSAKEDKQLKGLLPFASAKTTNTNALPFRLDYYLELVDHTGRCIRSDKKGHITENEPILERVNIAPENWLTLTTEFSRIFHGAVGREKMLQNFCDNVKRQRRTNLANCRRYLA